MDTTKLHHWSFNPYEHKYGYARVIRRGPFIFVSGTTSIDGFSATGELLHRTVPADSPDSAAYLQAKQAFKTIIESIGYVSGSKSDIVRIRMFVRDDADADCVGRALREELESVGPAATMILGARFVDPDMRVEIEADAVVLPEEPSSNRLTSPSPSPPLWTPSPPSPAKLDLDAVDV